MCLTGYWDCNWKALWTLNQGSKASTKVINSAAHWLFIQAKLLPKLLLYNSTVWRLKFRRKFQIQLWSGSQPENNINSHLTRRPRCLLVQRSLSLGFSLGRYFVNMTFHRNLLHKSQFCSPVKGSRTLNLFLYESKGVGVFMIQVTSSGLVSWCEWTWL